MRRLLVLIYALIFVDEMALLSLVPLVPSYRDALHLSGFESGVLLSAASLAIVVGSIPGGLAGDRLGSRRVTLAAGGLLALACLAQGLAPNLWMLVAARLVFGVASAVIWSAGLSWLSDSAGDERPGALGAVIAVAGVGGVVGPAFAGLLADRVDRGAPFLVLSGLAFLLVAALATADRGRELRHEHHPLSQIMGLARRDVLIGGALVMMLLGGFSDGLVNLVGPAQLDAAGRSSTWIGVVLSLAAGLFIVLSAAAARAGRRAVTLAVGAVCAAASALVLVPVLVSGAALVVALMLLLRAAPLGVMYAITFPLGVRGARRSGLGAGAVNGLLGFAWGSASFAGAIVAGGMVEASGARAVYGLLAASCIAATACLAVLQRG